MSHSDRRVGFDSNRLNTDVNNRKEDQPPAAIPKNDKMTSMPFLSSVDRNLAPVLRDIIASDSPEETKDQILRDNLNDAAWKEYEDWKKGPVVQDEFSFLSELSNASRILCEGYIAKREIDHVETILTALHVSDRALQDFQQWKQAQSTTPSVPNKSIFLSELRDGMRGMAEIYIEDGDFDKLENLLRVTQVSPEAMEGFKQWKAAKAQTRTQSESVGDVAKATETSLPVETNSTRNKSLVDSRGDTKTSPVCSQLTPVISDSQESFENITTDDVAAMKLSNEEEGADQGDSIKLSQNMGNPFRFRRTQKAADPIPSGQKTSNDSSSGSTPVARDDGSINLTPTQNQLALESLPDRMNILVLGETGVGKSTFINGLVNYLKYGSMEDALKGGVECLIESSFTLSDDDYRPYDIRCSPTISEEGRKEKSASNESSVVGQSATQDPKSYVFSVGSAGSEKNIRIIDTPGIGDTRGIDQDKANFDKILAFISNYSELHAVCILIKPNTARLTLAFRFCIDELLVHLHKSASRNILFCFTNTRGTLYKPGDTLPTLKQHLSSLEKNRGIHIPLDRSTLFCFDNESFRFLCAKKANFPFSRTDEENFSASWKKSVEETIKLFSRISELPVHSVQDTLSLNNTRNLILTLTRPLGEIAKTQILNVNMIDDKLNEVERNAMEGKNLKGTLYVDQVVISTKELDKPQTVCTAASCVEHQHLNGNSEVLQTIYKTVCHEDCNLQGVQVETVPNPALKSCFAMNGEVCKMCNCRWETHMHIKYKIEQNIVQVTDPDVEASIQRKDDANKTIQIYIEKEEEKMQELKNEHELITSYCAEFAAFLSHNSIIPYNDSYGQYVDHLIEEEKDKVSIGGGRRLLDELERMRNEYNQQVKMLNKSIKGSGKSVKSVAEIDAMIDNLSKLKHCGATIEEIKRLRIHQVKQTSKDHGHKVRVNPGFLGSAVSGMKKFLTGNGQ